MDGPFFSVLIPTRNRPELIGGCLRAVLAQDHPSVEILVLDQSDTDATYQAVREAAGGSPLVRHVGVSGRGRSRALNGGIPDATGIWIVMIDDDCEATPGWLDALEREARAAGPRAAVVGRVLPGPVEPGLAPPPATIEDPEPKDYAGRIPRDLVYPNFAVPREAFAELGLFDVRMGVGTELPGGEDNDFGYRLLRAGWRILYRPEPAVIHRAWRDPGERLALKRAYGLGQGAFYAKHLARLDPYIAYRFARDVAGTGRAAAGALLRGWRDERRGHLAFLGGLLAGAARMLLLTARGINSQERP
jgi:glycosyltransferase involved in cell wall biosynthesis